MLVELAFYFLSVFAPKKYILVHYCQSLRMFIILYHLFRSLFVSSLFVVEYVSCNIPNFAIFLAAKFLYVFMIPVPVNVSQIIETDHSPFSQNFSLDLYFLERSIILLVALLSLLKTL